MEKLFGLSEMAKANGITAHGILTVGDREINLAYINKDADGDVTLIEEAQVKYNFWACYHSEPKPAIEENEPDQETVQQSSQRS